MKKILFSLAAFFATFASAVAAPVDNYDNVIYAQDARIAKGGTVELPIYLKNSDYVVKSFQFNVTLPEGISFVSAADGYQRTIVPAGWTSTAATKEGVSSNIALVMGYYNSGSDLSIAQGDTKVMTLTLQADEDVTIEDKEIVIDAQKLTDGEGKGHQDGQTVTSKLSVVNYDAGYAVKMLPFKINTTDESTTVNVFINTASAATSVSFDVAFSSNDFKDQGLIETASLVSGRGTNCTITANSNGSYSINATKTAGFTAGSDVDIVKFTFYSQNEAGTYTIPQGIYNVSIRNVSLSDASQSYNVAPYSANIYVGSAKASVSEGCVSFFGDYSDSGNTNLLTAAMPTTDATLTTVDLTGVTAIASNTTITTANPNALIRTSVALNLTNEKNVVEGNTCDKLVLTDGYAFNNTKAFTASSASYSRNYNAAMKGLGTICLPYAVSSDANVTYYQLSSVADGQMNFTKVDNVPANTPALYQAGSSSSTVSISGAGTVAKSNGSYSHTTGDWEMVGELNGQTIDAANDAVYNYYYISAADGNFYRATGKVTVGSFRSFFRAPKSTTPVKSFGVSLDDETGITTVVTGSKTTDNATYDLSGRRVNGVERGIYIQNGKKYIK